MRGTGPMNASAHLSSTPDSQKPSAPSESLPRPLDPTVLPDHIDVLYRAAWALCGSRPEAGDLVQETFERVLKRPRLLRGDNNLGYLLRVLRNTYISRHPAAKRRPTTVPLLDPDSNDRVETDRSFEVRELMAALAAAPQPYRDAVVAVDLVGLSYREAA